MISFFIIPQHWQEELYFIYDVQLLMAFLFALCHHLGDILWASWQKIPLQSSK